MLGAPEHSSSNGHLVQPITVVTTLTFNMIVINKLSLVKVTLDQNTTISKTKIGNVVVLKLFSALRKNSQELRKNIHKLDRIIQHKRLQECYCFANFF